MNVTRKWEFDKGPTLGDLRKILEWTNTVGMADEATLSVDSHAAWVSGVDEDGRPAKPYPHGNGGHYRTDVEVSGQTDVLLETVLKEMSS